MQDAFKQQLVAAYDADAERRARASYGREDWKIEFREQFVRLLKQEQKLTVLEIGAGDGFDAAYLQAQGFEVLATDLSSKMVEQCRKRGVKAQVADLYELDKLGRRFDGIYSMNVLLHVPVEDLSRVLESIHGALADSGIFFLGTYGGVEREEVTTDPHMMNLPRFFSFLHDETLQNAVTSWFEILSFETIGRERHTVTSRDAQFHFQGLMLRKK